MFTVLQNVGWVSEGLLGFIPVTICRFLVGTFSARVLIFGLLGWGGLRFGLGFQLDDGHGGDLLLSGIFLGCLQNLHFFF